MITKKNIHGFKVPVKYRVETTVSNCGIESETFAVGFVQVNLTSTEGAIYLDDYIPSTEWQLLVAYTEVSYITYIEGDGGYSFVKFNIKMRRKVNICSDTLKLNITETCMFPF